MAKGIPETAIKPRENVFTYQAWRALGRQVRRGEHGIKVVTFVEMAKENRETGEKQSFRRPWTTTVFHISQTDTIVESSGGAA
jgi:antirestriction protein ArdC